MATDLRTERIDKIDEREPLAIPQCIPIANIGRLDTYLA